MLDAALDRCAELLDRAALLPRALRSPRLRLQANITLALARRLLARLRAADPLAARVGLTAADAAAAFARGLLGAPSDAAVVRARWWRPVPPSPSAWRHCRPNAAGRSTPSYAFCRAVDDIADAALPEAEKRRLLAMWRRRLAAPDCALSREFARAAARFALPRAEAEALLDGMETDCTPALRIPDSAAFDLYCRQVAGSVGAMSVRIFGAPEAEASVLSSGAHCRW